MSKINLQALLVAKSINYEFVKVTTLTYEFLICIFYYSYLIFFFIKEKAVSLSFFQLNKSSYNSYYWLFLYGTFIWVDLYNSGWQFIISY